MGAIVVTGAYRTGTSLMMQTLRIFGLPVAGMEYHPLEFPDDGLHPHGAWDLPNAQTLNGIHNNDYDGMAVKLFGLQLSRSSPQSISKVIICRRNRTDAVASAKYVAAMRHDEMLDFGEAYDRNYLAIGCYLGLHNLPSLDIQFEVMRFAPDTQLSRIAAFLCLCPSEATIEEAMQNVIQPRVKECYHA